MSGLTLICESRRHEGRLLQCCSSPAFFLQNNKVEPARCLLSLKVERNYKTEEGCFLNHGVL